MDEVPVIHVLLTSAQAQLVLDCLTYKIQEQQSRITRDRQEYRHELERSEARRCELEARLAEFGEVVE